MKLYSNVLTHEDLTRAIHAPNVPATVYLYQSAPLPRPRVRDRGWSVRLGNTVSRHFFQTGNGRYSITDPERGAAHYDDWGWWLAALFEIDPDMRAGEYHGIGDFHRKTRDAYRKVMEAR